MKLKSVRKPDPAFELRAAAAPPQRRATHGFAGADPGERSRSLDYLVVKGRSDVPLVPPGGRRGLESILGVDDRVRVLDTELPPWRMICALSLRGAMGSAIGTGWLVGPRTILTAGHCVYSTDFFGGWASAIEVSPGRNAATFPYGTIASRSFSSLDRWVEQQEPDFDIGCIHLEEAIGRQTGWFQVGTLPPEELERYLVNVSGYPGDRGGGTEQYHHRNRILHVSERRVFYDVDTYGGQSGAPVWIHETEDAPPLAIAIHAYGTGATPGNVPLPANSAPRIIPEVFEQIEAWVEQDGGW
jgi:V8-like Glu-specific endopeptidase